jgi:hypothetical protein
MLVDMSKLHYLAAISMTTAPNEFFVTWHRRQAKKEKLLIISAALA